MTTPVPAGHRLNDPRSQTAFRTLNALVGGYLGISVLTLAVIVALHDDPAAVNDAVWVRATIVVISALFSVDFARKTARGSQRAYLRLRIISAVMVVAIIVIIALPGTFPVWMKIEQAACGLMLLGVVLLVNGKHLRTLFGKK